MNSPETAYEMARQSTVLPIKKSGGVTDSEAKLCRLGYQTFLSLWSYPNLFQKHKLVKELCDLLVVFENHIIIFSDKDCAFGNSGDIKTDWIRWYKKAILNSANQLRGAMSWIKKCPDRICMDEKGEVDFPLTIEVTENTKFHLIAIAHGASDACKAFWGNGDGGLIITNDPPIDIKNRENCNPFQIGHIFPDGEPFIHVFDDSSYTNVLQEMDTIKDFVDYLSDKEKLFRSGVSVIAPSENELLAHHVSGLIEGRKTELFDLTTQYSDVSTVTFEEGLWEDLPLLPQYTSWKQQLEPSYFWDSLLQKTFYFIENGLSITTAPNIDTQSKLFQHLAREDRLHRASLAYSFRSFFEETPGNARGTRVIYGHDDPETCYVLLLLPRRSNTDEDSYRKARSEMLRDYCIITKGDFPQVKMVIGVAHETNEDFGSSEDFLSFDASEWSAEDQRYAEELKETYRANGLLGNRSQIGLAYNRKGAPEVKRMKGKDRNKPCPCGSGKKYKKCCGLAK